MNAVTTARIVALGAATGMRSFSGPAALAIRHGGPIAWVAAAMAAGEMAADKMPSMGNRTDAAPLAARALMGALVGGLVARRAGQPVAGGALLGAGVAVAAAHVAFRLRARVPGHAAALTEDAIVTAICAAACRRRRRWEIRCGSSWAASTVRSF